MSETLVGEELVVSARAIEHLELSAFGNILFGDDRQRLRVGVKASVDVQVSCDKEYQANGKALLTAVSRTVIVGVVDEIEDGNQGERLSIVAFTATDVQVNVVVLTRVDRRKGKSVHLPSKGSLLDHSLLELGSILHIIRSAKRSMIARHKMVHGGACKHASRRGKQSTGSRKPRAAPWTTAPGTEIPHPSSTVVWDTPRAADSKTNDDTNEGGRADLRQRVDVGSPERLQVILLDEEVKGEHR